MRKQKQKVACLGEFRTVVLTDGERYLTQFNTCFGIVLFGEKDDAVRMYLKDAPAVLDDLRRKGGHKLWAEVVVEGKPLFEIL